METLKRTLFIGAFAFLSLQLTQAQKQLGLNDLVVGGANFQQYRPQMPRGLQFWGDQLLKIEGDSLEITTPQGDELLFTKGDINATIAKQGAETLTSLSQVKFPYPDIPIVYLSNAEKISLYNFKTKTIEGTFSKTEGASRFDFSKESKTLAYTISNNLYVQRANGNEQQVTFETDSSVVCGQSVHRDEFGITKGTFWSPQGNLLAFYRMDQTMVTDYPLVDIAARTATLRNIKYPMAGMKSHEVTVGIYNPNTQTTVYLKTGAPKDKFLTNIAWSLDEKSVYIAELNRDQDTCKLKRYNAITGKLEATLFEETSLTYVEPLNPPLFLANHPNEFIWQSRKDGYNHAYLYNTQGELVKQITSGRWELVSILGFDSNENMYILSNEVSPLDKHIYQVNIKTGKRTQLSKEAGVHNPKFSATGKYICDVYTSQHNPGKVALIDTKSKKSTLLYQSKDPFVGCTFPSIELGSIKANDGETDLYYRMIKPSNFDPSKKYPVIVYVYGGPHSQLVQNSWIGAARGWDIYMAEKGYIMFTLDNRGTDNRGKAFSSITHRQLGIVETQDQMAGVYYLRSLPYIDSTRIGVHGWSFGGFMTLNMMLRDSETFKVGVAGGPVVDWKYYEVMYGERYMDTPQENPKGYEGSDMTRLAGNLKGHLLIIHGYVDNTVVVQHSLEFLKACIKDGTQPDYFLYPESEHNMRGAKRIHLYEKITRYFEDFL